ncbi:lysophospholipid acyltransferase family protein [Candidatus Poribacteria bacterium]|nr:lysophospholipid acyltransferase family protein [Candidatus Poribacteria bacterium]
MRRTIFDTPILNTLLHGVSAVVLRIIGWRREGRAPDIPKYVVIAAPHTTNWDLPMALLLAFACRIKVYWMGKDSIFRWPFGGFFMWLGGIPVDRGKSHGMVGQLIQVFSENERFVLVMAPEGTRKSVLYWKSGFYHIAMGAHVPIVLGYIDYGRKAGGIGPVITPTGDIDVDMEKFRAFYANVTGKHDRNKPIAVATRH